MKDFTYVLENFWTHKDFLASPDQIPGTLYTPMQWVFEAVVLGIIISAAVYVCRHKKMIKPVFTFNLVTLVVLEFIIVYWDSTAGKNPGFDFSTSLSLYPCSIFMYAMPFAIWGRGAAKQAACGYVCTLGLMGALVNFIYPVARLETYSCISFPAFHTFYFHGSMLFTCMVMLMSGYHRFRNVSRWWELFLASLPGLIVSIPANLVNYSPIDADYMYFRGKFPLIAGIFSGMSDVTITAIIYALYLVVPALFYLPSYLAQKRSKFQTAYTLAETTGG